MNVTAGSWYEVYGPTKCEKRPRLISVGVVPAEKDLYQELLETLGRQYEAAYLAGVGLFTNLKTGGDATRLQETRKAIRRRDAVLYQPHFTASVQVDGQAVDVVGDPDFLVWDGDGYLIRDVKIARRVTQRDKPQIWHQLQAYGFLLEALTGEPPKGLQIYNGLGELIDFPYMGKEAFIQDLTMFLRSKAQSPDLYEPVGWTKCGQCPYKSHCWPEAIAAHDVALVYGVSQEAARSLRDRQVETIEQLAAMDTADLSEMKVRSGSTERRFGKPAAKTIQMAKVLAAGKPVQLAPLALPAGENFVMFDLEGLPPQIDETDKIYLWGFQPFIGGKPRKYVGAVADLDTDWDKESWFLFLREIRNVFEAYGDIPLVHWHHYEKTHVQKYIERYGDPDGIASRVLRNLFDLLPVCRDSIALPLYSYSLKEVEKYVGFKRSQKEYGGSWSIAKFIEAVETHDKKMRAETLDLILIYNEEDLGATWAVFNWLRAYPAVPSHTGTTPGV